MKTRHGSSIDIILRLRFSGDQRLGRGKMELLSHIKDTGSISAAGRAMDMSYRRAWLLVTELNDMFDTPSVERQRGGQKGGGAFLTPFGEELLLRFRQMEATIEASLAADLEWLQTHYSGKGRSDADSEIG